MEKFNLDAVVIGAGVVGLAVARALALSGKSVWILDKADGFGHGTSSRNSEVIHAGIYYPESSLKAKLCVRGKHMLYDYLRERSLPHKRCGKFIVATNSAQAERLSAIAKAAERNGVGDLDRCSKHQMKARMPELNAEEALYSPSTGIVDSHALMQSLLNDAEAAGAQFVPQTEIRVRTVDSNRHCIELVAQNTLVGCSTLVNAAGLYAISLLQGCQSFPNEHLPEPSFAKGSYFSYSGKVPFTSLVYPVPEKGGLGVHLTLDLNGAARFGPDVEWTPIVNGKAIASNRADLAHDTNLRSWLDHFDFSVADEKREAFRMRISEYWPKVESEKLHADYSGLRPKILLAGQIHPDFMIQSAAAHGIEGLVNLFGIESPGLTSCLTIAEHVEQQLS